MFCILFFGYFCVYPCNRANFVIGLCAVKFERKYYVNTNWIELLLLLLLCQRGG
jgi:hypothetical protein